MMMRMVGGWVFLLVPAHPGSPGQRAVKRLLLLLCLASLLCLKDMKINFLEEHRRVIAPTAVASDRLPGEKTCYCAELLPNLFKVNNQRTSLQSVNFRHCTSLLSAVTAASSISFNNLWNCLLKLTLLFWPLWVIHTLSYESIVSNSAWRSTQST